MKMYESVTEQIAVSVETQFIEDQSDPDEEYYIWAYRITIANHGSQTVQLISRHWVITDAHGRCKEVRGDGVVGEQPILAPGESYTYSSGTPLNTASGFMHGSYLMRCDNGREFDAQVPAFSLDSPFSQDILH
jgi:ApaG protein